MAVMGTTLADASVLAGADPVALSVEDLRTQGIVQQWVALLLSLGD